MSIHSLNSRFSSRAKAMALVATMLASLFLVVAPAGAANATPRVKPAKVTICHRTHSTTNPYRMITVAKSSVDGDLNVRSSGNGNSANGDHAASSHNPLDLVQNGSSRKVFDPTYTYPNNAKKWQDIIPSFTVDETPSRTVTYSGLNWDSAGKAIYFGTGSMFGLCKKMSAKQFLNSEVTAGQSPASILADLREQGADEDSGLNLTNTDGLSNVPDIPAGPTPPAGTESLSQAIAGVVWYDLNHNGLQDDDCTSMNRSVAAVNCAANSVTVQLLDPDGNPYTSTPVSYKNKKSKPTKFKLASNIVANPVTAYSGVLTTGADGSFIFPSVPEGQWTVTFIAPSGYKFTYDALGTADGATSPIVPPGGAGFTWAGLIDTSASWTYSIGDPLAGQLSASDAAALESTDAQALANTGMSSTGWIAGAIALQMIGLGVVLMWLRRRKAK